MRTLITGYAGFIGSNLTRHLLKSAIKQDSIVGLDCYTYAARPEWALEAVRAKEISVFTETKIDLRSKDEVMAFIQYFKPNRIYHLAAESHVCRSIEGPRAFAETNFMGTFNILEALRQIEFDGRLVHVSTDEAFGELKHGEEPFSDLTPVKPRSPYAASKCASDLMVQAYVNTYGLDAVITRCTNNYGPNQHEEKLIPKAIHSIVKGKEMTLYGDGSHSRDWIYVEDHCKALERAMIAGLSGQVYPIGSGLELTNKEVVMAVREVINKDMDLKIRYTDDRPTDDVRYAVNTDKSRKLGFIPIPAKDYFLARLKHTVDWYLKNAVCQ